MAPKLEFDPQDPYPLLDPGTYTYAELKTHADQVDAWLGLQVSKVETALVATQGRGPAARGESVGLQPETWIGVAPSTFLTPYAELREMIERLAPPPGARFVDLGAGYGRLGFVLGRHFAEAHFLGYELVAERVAEGMLALERQGCQQARLVTTNLAASDFRTERADFYFIYDFGERAAIEKVLGDLREVARSGALTVIGRGRATRDAIERGHPWLAGVRTAEHCGNYSIYRS